MEHYNYFRDYDPAIGRYVESDPLGLAADLNTYAYVQSQPLTAIDPRGQDVAMGARAGWRIGAMIGTAIEPGVGTAIGAAVGAAGGAAIGYFVCKKMANEADCKEEIEDCSQRCTEAQGDPDRRHFFGGSMSQCMRNCVSERCGGEPKWKGYKNLRGPKGH